MAPGHRHLDGAGGGLRAARYRLSAHGILAEGALNVPGWTYAEIELDAIARVRREGVVLNRAHWDDQQGRDGTPRAEALRQVVA